MKSILFVCAAIFAAVTFQAPVLAQYAHQPQPESWARDSVRSAIQEDKLNGYGDPLSPDGMQYRNYKFRKPVTTERMVAYVDRAIDIEFNQRGYGHKKPVPVPAASQAGVAPKDPNVITLDRWTLSNWLMALLALCFLGLLLYALFGRRNNNGNDSVTRYSARDHQHLRQSYDAQRQGYGWQGGHYPPQTPAPQPALPPSGQGQYLAPQQPAGLSPSDERRFVELEKKVQGQGQLLEEHGKQFETLRTWVRATDSRLDNNDRRLEESASSFEELRQSLARAREELASTNNGIRGLTDRLKGGGNAGQQS